MYAFVPKFDSTRPKEMKEKHEPKFCWPIQPEPEIYRKKINLILC